MLDLQEKYFELDARLSVLERVNELYDRVDIVGRNVLNLIDKVATQLTAQMDERFDRLETSVNERFAKVDERFDHLESILLRIDGKLPDQRLN